MKVPPLKPNHDYMANNFFLNQDPLLYQGSSVPRFENEEVMRKQLNDAMSQYRTLQQQTINQPNSIAYDYVGELDKLLKTVDSETEESLNHDEEYLRLSAELSEIVNRELMANIKWKINANTNAVKNIERQTEIINASVKKTNDQQRQNITEINDYIKNYSDLTFDEYKKLKDNK